MITSDGRRPKWQALSIHGLKRKKIFQSILFPVDFSPASKEAAPYVRNLAELTGGTVTLFHVVPWRSAWYGAADVQDDENSCERLRGIKRAQLCALAAFQDEYFEGVSCEKRVEAGCIGEQIVDYAEHTGTDLIMMATSAHAHGPRRFVSPTLTHVLREAPCPVWTAPQSDRLCSFEGFNNIICALPQEGISGSYVNEAVAVADVFGSKLTFVSAVSPGVARTEECRVLCLEEEFPEAGLDQLASGSRLPVYVETGPVGHVVRHIAEIQSADLVVINRRHRSHYSKMLDGHTQEIVMDAPCPILVLPARVAAASVHILEAPFDENRYAVAGVGV
jgi:nucleotide-binding universal stress UspA family protein